MSFSSIKQTVGYGDTVLLHVGYDNMLPMIVTKGMTHQTKFGALRHDSVVGKKFGTRIQCPKGWIYILHPTPELWTLSLPHRTQILYTTDISMVVFQLDLQPGSVVAEAGTGSGSLSHAILRTILPTGHLHTYEFHKERAEKAKEEFHQHGHSGCVTVTHRDVCGEGFQLDHIVDAVFLDLPKPWECVTSAKKAMKKQGGRLCSFSPCIEQVQRTCEELSAQNFSDIVTMECLARHFNIQYAKLQNLSFESSASESTADKETSNRESYSEPPVKSASATLSSSRHKEVKRGGSDSGSHNFPSAVPALNMPGHTGFLTFATLTCH
ncbi:tRNA (adenine(58)-n(1))-methyltransferase catalytic subunit trmt61a [Plakobranchus ocellatus]|uniref:tRNA (adenine(58)-N(1))-methyltransferase catalytic subunit TRMT61A n=1 Tax=Plakobranchus ocellatus TaxID=259542 RepID=A0AAV3YMK4_9GAST|nr:tRNA (adenine(58)-n(1))-methyltransferase catalytic subunit trmt61a [Plakobranchus ocellatus]